MLWLKTVVNVADNTAECIKVLRKAPKNCALIGDRVVVVVQKAKPISHTMLASQASHLLRQGDIRHAVVVRTKQPTRRADGSMVRFDDNAVVLIDKDGEPLGTRVTSVIARELRAKGFNKVVSLAPRLV